MRIKPVSFLFVLILTQFLFAGYLLVSSFLFGSLQGRYREIDVSYAQDYQHSLETWTIDNKYKNPPVEVGLTPSDLANSAAKASGEAESYAGYSMFVGFLLFLFSVGEFFLVASIRRKLREKMPPPI